MVATWYEPMDGRQWCARPTCPSAALRQNEQCRRVFVPHRRTEFIQEIAHALLHLTDHDGPGLSYAEEEIVVESIAFSVVGGLGIDTSGYSIPYLTAWSQDDADMEIVEACAELIDHHAKRIENAIGDPPDPTATSETTEPRAPAARVPRDPRV
jgi:hypothetical protein